MLSDLFYNFKFFLNKKLKIRLLIIFILHFINTLLDIISVASIPAILIFFFNKNEIQVEINYINDILNYFLKIFDGTPITLIFSFIILFFILKTLLGIVYYILFTKFGFDLEVDISKKVVEKKLGDTYFSYIQTPYSSFLNLMTYIITDFLQNNFLISFQILINLLTILTFTIFLFLINPITTISIIGLGIVGFIFYYLITKKKFIFFGKYKLILVEQTLSKIKDIFYSFKEIKIYGKEDIFIDKFTKIKKAWALNKIKFQVISNLPKLFLELILVAIIVSIFYFSYKLNLKFETTLINITVFIISAQRLFPRIIVIIRNYSKINYSKKAQRILVKELEKEIPPKQKMSKITFKDKIKLKNINYGYTTKNIILENINLEIKKGSFIGIKGESGEGKTTLINILMGLLKPLNGDILLDNKNIKNNLKGYMNLISYIPQKIYILHDTIKNNLVFDDDQFNINESDIDNVLDTVRLSNLKNDHIKGLETIIADTTFKASEGETQRFGIARALLKKKEILILDEITSSLDEINENNIMNIIKNLKGSTTIIMISHKNSSLKFCDQVYTLQNKKLSEFQLSN